MFRRRPDGTLVRELSTVRRFMPFISPQRNHSLVYFSQDVDVEDTLRFVDEYNQGRPMERRLTLFHLILRGLARILDERPRLNRFVAGGRVWQRDGIWITFSAKMRFDEEAPVTTVKLRLDPQASAEEMLDQIHVALRERRSERKDVTDREMEILLRLPAPLLRLGIRCVRGLDALGLLPGSMIRSDPMYASVFVANLGSVGLDAGYHHLWEYGTISIFCVVGRVGEGADGRRCMTLKYTYDERVEDGLYCARSLERLRELLENPKELA